MSGVVDAADLIAAVMSGDARITFTSGFSLFNEGPTLVGAYVEERRNGRWKRIGYTLYAPYGDNTRGGVLRSLAKIADGEVRP
jgi:hypothetical protein